MAVHAAAAADLPRDEIVLEDAHSGCRLRYLTAKNTRGWSMDVMGKACPDGWVDGRADIRVFDAFVRPQQTLSGSFTHGYWTGDDALNAPSQPQRLSSESGVQSLIYPLESGTPGLSLWGKADARLENGVYSAFQACRPAQVFILTSDMGNFIHVGRREKLFADVVKKMRPVCAALKKVVLTGVRDKITDKAVFRGELDVMAGTSDIQLMPDDTPPAAEEVSPSESTAPAVSSVQALMTASRILKKPVFGTAVVRVRLIGLDGVAQADKPLSLSVQGKDLKTGWVRVSGMWHYAPVRQLGGVETGGVRASQIQSCADEKCGGAAP